MSLRFRVSCVRTRILSRSGRSEVPAGTLPLPRVGGRGFARPSPPSRVAASLHLGLQSYKHFPTYGAPCAALSSRGQPPCSSRRGKVRQPLPAAVALRRGGTAHAPLWRSDPARPLLPKGTLVIARTKSLPLRERYACRCANDALEVARVLSLRFGNGMRPRAESPRRAAVEDSASHGESAVAQSRPVRGIQYAASLLVAEPWQTGREAVSVSVTRLELEHDINYICVSV